MVVSSPPTIKPSPLQFKLEFSSTSPSTTCPHAAVVDGVLVSSWSCICAWLSCCCPCACPCPCAWLSCSCCCCPCAIEEIGCIIKPPITANDTIVATMYAIIVCFIQ